MLSISVVPTAVVLVGVLIAAVTDCWKFRVYNSLTLPMIALGLLYHTLTGGAAGLGSSTLGMLFGFASLILVYALGGMGAGDVKLMAAIGAWLGLELTLLVFAASSLAGGVYALALIVRYHGYKETYLYVQILYMRLTSFSRHLLPEGRVEQEIRRDDRRRRLVPFAAMVAVGVVSTFIWLAAHPETREARAGHRVDVPIFAQSD